MYKFILSILTLVACTINTYAQDYKTEIKTNFEDYLNTIADRDYEKMFTYLPEDLFNVVPKEELQKVMESLFSNPAMDVKITNNKLDAIRQPEKINGTYYARLDYSNIIHMRFNKEEGETDEEQKDKIIAIKFNLIKKFGKEKVYYNKETDFFEVKFNKEAYAISENGLTDWKFITIEKSQPEMLKKLLPKKLCDRILLGK